MSLLANHKEKAKQHYYRVMPNQKRYRIAIWIAFLLVVMVVALQMLYPLDRAVPFARLGDQQVGWQQELVLAGAIGSRFEKTNIRLEAGHKIIELPLANAGVEPRVMDMTAKLIEYPFWQRLVPGSILWQRPSVRTWELTFADRPLSELAEAKSKELSFDSKNATLELKDGKLVATNDSEGNITTPEQVKRALQRAVISYEGMGTINVANTLIKPHKTAADFTAVRAQAELALALPMMIYANSTIAEPSAAEKASWLQLAENEIGNTVLTLKVDTLNAYLDELSKKAGMPAGRTNIIMQNGRETGREPGVRGSKINNQLLVPLLENYLLNGVGRPPFIAEMTAVEPSIIYNNAYTATQDGLRAFIADKAKKGAWISIRQLDGDRWIADADATESVVSGSTYKLYVAMYLFKEMAEGKRDWRSPILDTDTDTCFDRMTIASTNPCAEEWLRQFGAKNLNSYLYEKNFSRATTFINPEAAHTSALDLTTYMVGLEEGTLVSGAYRDRLLSSLAKHPYRYGIPAGSKGQVWDKVGFIWDYVNDTAIVHHPRGTYVMTIMTKGKSYAAIAQMTREIEAIMYPQGV